MKANNRIVAAILTSGLMQQPSGETHTRDTAREAKQAVKLYRRVLRALRDSRKNAQLKDRAGANHPRGSCLPVPTACARQPSVRQAWPEPFPARRCARRPVRGGAPGKFLENVAWHPRPPVFSRPAVRAFGGQLHARSSFAIWRKDDQP